MRLLFAEDERSLSRAIVKILEKNHYTIDAVYDGKEALEYALMTDYDGIILDIMMPEMDGISVLKTLRAKGIKTPVLILSAKSEVDDKVTGLDNGANDYLTKPFAMKELLARLRVLTRSEAHTDHCLRFGNVTLNSKTFELSTPKGSFRLAKKEFQMMEMLIHHPGHLISAERFFEHIWGYDSEAEIGIVWVYLSYLRKKLAAIESDVWIRMTRGTGYSLEKKDD